MANPTITINATGITVSGPLIAGEPVAVTASGLSLPEGAALTLALSSRAPNALLASCVLAESEETPGTWTGTLETASRQMAVYFATAAADDTRPAVLELVETTTRDSLALLVTSIRNSALIPSSSPCSVAPVYIPVPGPPGDPQPSDADPLVDGTVSPGVSADYSRSDHRHPTDTTRQAVIEDLATIRSGAAAGATAVQQDNIAPQWSASATYPPDSCVFREGVLFFSVKQTGPGWNENDWIVPPNGVVQRINGSIDSLAVAVNQVSGALSNKQDIIHDLATIRSGAAAGATAVQPADLATVATTGNYNDLTNKPTIPAAQVNADWNASSGIAQILNKPTIPPAQIQSDWNQTNTAAVDYIKNKPTIPDPAPSPSTATPQMDGAGSAGTATTYARGDHQHPSDTTRAKFGATEVYPGLGPVAVRADWELKNPGGPSAYEQVDIPLAGNLAPAFSASSTYAVGDYCTHEGILYRCTTAVSTAGAWNVANWSEVAVTDEMGGGGASYYEIEYLESTGTQYINTGISSSIPTRIQIDLACTAWAENSTPIGATKDSVSPNTERMFVAVSASGNYWSFGASQTYTNPATQDFAFALGERVTLDMAVTASGLTFQKNGSTIYTDTTARSLNVSRTLYAFARHNTNSTGTYFTGRIYGLKIWQGDTLVRDFVPVRSGFVGALLDRVSGAFFTNNGTGEFLLGQDVNPPVPTDSPAFTGTPTAPTAAAGTNTTQIATTAFVQTAARYAFASTTPTVSGTSATVACEDRAINDFTVATGITSLTITPPAAVTGRARDFFCRVTLTDSSLPTVTLSGGTIDIGASEVAGMTQGVNLLMFTEIASGHWLASRRSAP